jgi:hypothetical protein
MFLRTWYVFPLYAKASNNRILMGVLYRPLIFSTPLTCLALELQIITDKLSVKPPVPGNFLSLNLTNAPGDPQAIDAWLLTGITRAHILKLGSVGPPLTSGVVRLQIPVSVDAG